MDSTGELETAVREVLESRGVMLQLKAQIRAEVFKALDDHELQRSAQDLPDENMIINKLIKDYLQFNGYTHTLSVFKAESGGEAREDVAPEFLAHEMGFSSPEEDSVPLLYHIVAHLRRQNSASTKPHPPISSVNSAPSHTHHHGNTHTSDELLSAKDSADKFK